MEVLTIFQVNSDIQDIYLNELKKFALYNSKFDEDDESDEEKYAEDINFLKDVDPTVYAVYVEKIVTLANNIKCFSSPIINDDFDYDFALKNYIDFFKPKDKLVSKELEDSFFSNKIYHDIFFYSLLNDFIKLNLFTEYVKYYLGQKVDWDSPEILNLNDDDYEDYYKEKLNYITIFQEYRTFITNDSALEDFYKITYKSNKYICDFIETHNLSFEVADEIEVFARFCEKYFYNGQVSDECYHKRFCSFLEDITAKNCIATFISFEDLFTSIKYKDLLNSYASKFLKMNKQYNLVKFANSFWKLESSFANTLFIGTAVLDYLNELARNKEIENIKSKIYLLELQEKLLLDTETMFSLWLCNISVDLFEFIESEETISLYYPLVNFNALASNFISAHKIFIEKTKFKNLVPHNLSKKKLINVLKDKDRQNFVLDCYQDNGPDVLTIKESLNVDQLRFCNLIIDQSDYFKASGLIKNLIG